MGFLRKLLDKQGELFGKGKKLERFYPLHEAIDTLLYTPGHLAKRAPFVRDASDLKRVMGTVVFALLPVTLMAMYNTGLQANLAIAGAGEAMDNWRSALVLGLGLDFDPNSVLACFVHGAAYFIPVSIVTLAVGGFWEVLFAIVRKHEVNEGFFVTWMLFPLILPPTIPLWEVALGISFGVVLGKEVFGGTGFNFLNPALTARAFLFFAYPAEISGNAVWVAVDGMTTATPLAVVYEHGMTALTQSSDAWMNAFMGFMPGSMGETSTLACLIGAALLILTGVGSWRVMASVTVGTILMALLLNSVGSTTNPMFEVPFWWHFVLGGWALGTVFMATDPVSAAYSNTGRYIYGFLIGVLVVLVRVINPAYPEGMMLAILLMNAFAPLIDYYVVRAHVKRRKARYAA